MTNSSRRYEDRRIALTQSGVEIRNYYFPVGTKRIAYGSIRGVQRVEMSSGILSGRWRIWGSGDFKHWFNLDTRRPKKKTALVVDVGKRLQPVLTPDDPDQAVSVLQSHGISVTTS